MTKVESMTSTRTGSPVANQFIIRTEGGRFFQSYDSVIALITNDGRVFLDEKFYDYSKTTVKYRNQFLGMTSKEVLQKIKENKFMLVDLNKEGV